MIKLEDTGAIILTLNEFVEKAGYLIKDLYLSDFLDLIGDNPRFWMYRYHDIDNPQRYCLDNNIDCIREIKYMKRYNEIWIRKFYYNKTEEGKKGCWSLWAVQKIV